MTRPRTMIDALGVSLKEAAQTFEGGTHWRAALLWPDPDNQFTGIHERLREALASHGVALYRLGPYAPDTGTGPSIWLRCLLDARLDCSPPDGAVPVFLLPGISSTDLKHPQTLSKLLRPLAELQYRGDIFRNRRQARDWTVGTFLRSPEQGLSLDVATDARTDEAAASALSALLTFPLSDLPTRRLTAEDFLRMIEPDEVRALLAWIADPKAARNGRSPEQWESVRNLVKSTFGIDMSAKGARQVAVERLAAGEGAWRKVLDRIDESPEQHRAVCEELRKAEKPMLPGFGEPVRGSSGDNALKEQLLATMLEQAADLPHREAIERILSLEDMHAPRRRTRWAKLGEAPLARVLEPLARLATEVRSALPGVDVPGLAQAYADSGYAADAALIDALALAGAHNDLVSKVACALYWPWVDPLANRFRAALEAGASIAQTKPLSVAPGTCVLFVDGLRFDLGRRLVDRLADSDAISWSWRLAPVPTVTATAKPLVTPVSDAIRGAGRPDVFLPLETSSGKPADTACLVAAMRARGVEVMANGETRAPSSPSAIGWSECGHLDKDGHSMGERLAGQVEGEIEMIAHRVQALRRSGWPRVRVVTDHGWLLIPGGLPKANIAASTLQTTAWARVARLTDGAAPEISTLPWHFDPSVRIALPPGAHAFRAGEAYAHGGVSLQECVIPDILIGDEGANAASAGARGRISSLVWKRYRLSVTLDRDAATFEVEVRRSERDPVSRVAVEVLGRDGPLLDLRVDPDLDEESSVVVVLLDEHGSVIDAKQTAIGVN